MPDVALYSPAVPPVRSGQTVILHRLLKSVEPRNYLLIANADAQNKRRGDVITSPLGAREELIHSVTTRPSPLPGWRNAVGVARYARREITARAREFSAILEEQGVKTLVICTGDVYDFVAAYRAAERLGIRVVAYLFDDYLYQAPRYLRPLAFLWERRCLRGAAEVLVTNEYFADLVRARHGVAARVLHNPIDLPELAEKEGASPFPSDEQSIVFSGTIYNAHYDAFRNLALALTRLEEKARLHIFSYQNAADLSAHGIQGDRVVFEGHRTQAEVLAAQRHADILFLPLAFVSPLEKLLRTAAPGKIAEYLAMGKPILVHAPPDTFLSHYFRTHECGVVVDRDEPELVVEAIERIVSDASLRERISTNALNRAREDFAVNKVRADFLEAVGLA